MERYRADRHPGGLTSGAIYVLEINPRFWGSVLGSAAWVSISRKSPVGSRPTSTRIDGLS